jgi:pimeloyl-ACP methyl ester carboxylesterase
MLMRARLHLLAVGILVLVAGCGGSADNPAAKDPSTSAATPSVTTPAASPDGVVSIGGGRGLYVRCSGTGSPTVGLEGGDEDTSASYSFAEDDLAQVTRTCVYDRANLGQSDPAPGPREMKDYVGDLEKLFAAADIGAPYVLVGTSGGGCLVVGYAVEHRQDVAGIVLVDTGGEPWKHPPKEIVQATDPDNPDNIEKRDYLQIERDAWAAKRRIGDIPVSIISVEYSPEEIRQSPFPAEQRGMRRILQAQRGWFVLSPQARQIVTHGGHAVEESDPDLVIKTIIDVVESSRG